MRGPTAAFGAVIALAAGIATSRAGTALGGMAVSGLSATGTTAAVISSATSAAFTTLCSQAALSLVTHNGDFGKAAKSLTTTEAFKSLGLAMATAGLSDGGLGRVAAGFTVDVATGKKIDEAALNAARVAVVSTLQATAAKYIGAGGLDPVTRGMMHGFTGAAAGAALGKDAKEGAISGAIAAVAATTVANFIKEDPNIIGERAVAKAKADGSPLDKASLEPYVQAELRGMIDISRLSGAVATLFAGYDVSVGIETATTAVINNCAATMERQVFESSALREALQDAVDAGKTVAADVIDDTADFIDEHPEKVERAAEAFMGAAAFMAEDRGGKAPKIKTKSQAKADKVLRKGIAAGLKSLPKHLRAAADKLRGNGAKSGSFLSKTHGNSRQYVGDTHVYVVRDGEGNLHKVGESMRGVNRFGQSVRAETQRRKLERQTGTGFETEIRRTFPTKTAARTWESRTIKRYRSMFGADKLPGNKGNR